MILIRCRISGIQSVETAWLFLIFLIATSANVNETRRTRNRGGIYKTFEHLLTLT